MGTKKIEDTLILGHMPMIGVSYQNKERDEEYRKRFSDENEMAKVIETAVNKGVRKFASATPGSSPLASLHIRVLRDFVDQGLDVQLIPCLGIPLRLGERMVDDYRRWATYLLYESKTYHEVRQHMLDDPVLSFRDGWRELLPISKPYGGKDFQDLNVDWRKIEENMSIFKELPVQYIEPGSETDFLALAGRFDLLGELIDKILEAGFRGILFGVHHAGMTIPKLEEELNRFDGYLTPLNSLGVMMFPTKASAEAAVNETCRDVYAIKPFAGGRVEPRTAFTYVFSFPVKGCIFGAGSVSEVEMDLGSAIEVISDTCIRG
jgi:hypothetical protein